MIWKEIIEGLWLLRQDIFRAFDVLHSSRAILMYTYTDTEAKGAASKVCTMACRKIEELWRYQVARYIDV